MINIPPIGAIREVVTGDSRSTLTKAVKALNDAGYTDGNGSRITPAYLRLRLAETDQMGEYDRASELLSSRGAKATNHRLRKDIAALVERLGTEQAFIDGITEAVSRLTEDASFVRRKFVGAQAGKPMTVEVLFSDWQIGKTQPGYNTKVAIARLEELGQSILYQIETKEALGYRIECIKLALLGDIIESDKKHKNSMRATDSSTAEQIADAMTYLFRYLIAPLARIGIRLDIIAVPGNHDWDDHGMASYRPGRDMLSWPLYRGLELQTQVAGYDNVTWDIVEGTYGLTEIYGQHVLYEHGVGVSVTEASMKAHKTRRSEQEGKHITYFRMGDKHNVSSFDTGRYVVNGALFGSGPGGQEYSSIAGYSSVPAQWMGFHVARNDPRLTLYDTFIVQLAHIGEDINVR